MDCSVVYLLLLLLASSCMEVTLKYFAEKSASRVARGYELEDKPMGIVSVFTTGNYYCQLYYIFKYSFSPTGDRKLTRSHVYPLQRRDKSYNIQICMALSVSHLLSSGPFCSLPGTVVKCSLLFHDSLLIFWEYYVETIPILGPPPDINISDITQLFPTRQWPLLCSKNFPKFGYIIRHYDFSTIPDTSSGRCQSW